MPLLTNSVKATTKIYKTSYISHNLASNR